MAGCALTTTPFHAEIDRMIRGEWPWGVSRIEYMIQCFPEEERFRMALAKAKEEEAEGSKDR